MIELRYLVKTTGGSVLITTSDPSGKKEDELRTIAGKKVLQQRRLKLEMVKDPNNDTQWLLVLPDVNRWENCWSEWKDVPIEEKEMTEDKILAKELMFSLEQMSREELCRELIELSKRATKLDNEARLLRAALGRLFNDTP